MRRRTHAICLRRLQGIWTMHFVGMARLISVSDVFRSMSVYRSFTQLLRRIVCAGSPDLRSLIPGILVPLSLLTCGAHRGHCFPATGLPEGWNSNLDYLVLTASEGLGEAPVVQDRPPAVSRRCAHRTGRLLHALHGTMTFHFPILNPTLIS